MKNKFLSQQLKVSQVVATKSWLWQKKIKICTSDYHKKIQRYLLVHMWGAGTQNGNTNHFQTGQSFGKPVRLSLWISSICVSFWQKKTIQKEIARRAASFHKKRTTVELHVIFETSSFELKVEAPASRAPLHPHGSICYREGGYNLYSISFTQTGLEGISLRK